MEKYVGPKAKTTLKMQLVKNGPQYIQQFQKENGLEIGGSANRAIYVATAFATCSPSKNIHARGNTREDPSVSQLARTNTPTRTCT